jgi:hypothetical protein
MSKAETRREAAMPAETAYKIAMAITPDFKTAKRVARALLIFDTLTQRRMARKVFGKAVSI